MIAAQQIIEIAKRNCTYLEEKFQPMTTLGKLECITYNSLISFFSAQSKYVASEMDETAQDLFALLIGELKLSIDAQTDDELGELVESRFAIHTKDIVMILDGGAQHNPENSFFYFYVKPLSKDSVINADEKLMEAFKPLLVNMTNEVLKEADGVMDSIKN